MVTDRTTNMNDFFQLFTNNDGTASLIVENLDDAHENGIEVKMEMEEVKEIGFMLLSVYFELDRYKAIKK